MIAITIPMGASRQEIQNIVEGSRAIPKWKHGSATDQAIQPTPIIKRILPKSGGGGFMSTVPFWERGFFGLSLPSLDQPQIAPVGGVLKSVGLVGAGIVGGSLLNLFGGGSQDQQQAATPTLTPDQTTETTQDQRTLQEILNAIRSGSWGGSGEFMIGGGGGDVSTGDVGTTTTNTYTTTNNLTYNIQRSATVSIQKTVSNITQGQEATQEGGLGIIGLIVAGITALFVLPKLFKKGKK